MLEIWCRKDYLKMYTMPKWYKLLKLVFLNYFIVFPEGFWNRLKKTLNFSVVFRARSINPWPRISGFASQLYLTLFWYHSFYFPCGGQLSVHEELLHKRLSMSTSLVTFLLLPVTSAAVVGISHSMVLSVAPLIELMARSIYGNSSWSERAKNFTVTVTLKDSAITFTREKCEWDFGLETAIMAMHLLTRTQGGPQCPGSSLKKWREHNTKLDWPHISPKTQMIAKLSYFVILKTF